MSSTSTTRLKNRLNTRLLPGLALGLLLSLSPCWRASLAQGAVDDSTFRQLGGKEGIAKIVEIFLPIIESDTRINDVFKDTKMALFGEHLAVHLCELSDGPCKFDGDSMKAIHAGMKITNSQFNALTEDLQIAMERQGVPYSAQNKLVARMAPMQRVIVTK